MMIGKYQERVANAMDGDRAQVEVGLDEIQ